MGEEKKGCWWCVDCERWHRNGKICSVNEIRKIRDDREAWRKNA